MPTSPSNRRVCTKTDPWDRKEDGWVVHPDAEKVGECLHGCCDRYECPNCGTAWTAELPQ